MSAIQRLIDEAYDLVAHWDSPERGESQHTARYVSALRDALFAIRDAAKQPVAISVDMDIWTRANTAELEAKMAYELLAMERADAARWRKLRDTPATHMPPGPMRQWLFARPGGAESMDRMVDEWPGPNVEVTGLRRED